MKFFVGSLYLLSSFTSTVINKYLMVSYSSHIPLLILLIQTVFLVGVLLLLKGHKALIFNHNVLIIALLLLVMVYTGIISLRHLSITQFIILKNLTIVTGLHYDKKSLLVLIFLLCSLINTSLLKISLSDYCIITLNIISHLVYLHKYKEFIKGNKSMETLSVMVNIQLYLLPLLLIGIVLKGESLIGIPIKDLLCIGLSSIGILCVGIFTVESLRIFDPVSVNILGALNKFMLSVGSRVILKDNAGIESILLSVLASIIYLCK